MNPFAKSTVAACTTLGGILFALAAPASAMTIKNADAEIRRIVVTEGGDRTEQDVLPNETVTLCESGCFITFPNGALTAYEGNEDIIIKEGGPALPN
jgi:hypothetical protein